MKAKFYVPEIFREVEIVKNQDDPTRYVVIDCTNGKVIDDAQGYGYRSVDKALWGFKYQIYNYIDTVVKRIRQNAGIED